MDYETVRLQAQATEYTLRRQLDDPVGADDRQAVEAAVQALSFLIRHTERKLDLA